MAGRSVSLDSSRVHAAITLARVIKPIATPNFSHHRG